MIAIGSDHGGFELKKVLLDFLAELEYEYTDFGTFDGTSVDYPDIADKVCNAVSGGDCALGILVCGTGIGMNMCANKHKGIRAAQCSDTFSAKMTRQHNNANMLAFGARVIGPATAEMIVDEFLNATYEGGRHQKRIDMITAIENGEM